MHFIMTKGEPHAETASSRNITHANVLTKHNKNKNVSKYSAL